MSLRPTDPVLASSLAALSFVAMTALHETSASAYDLPPLPPPGMSAVPPAPVPHESRDALSFGLRVGYSVPGGALIGGDPARHLSDLTTGMLPVRIDAGYKFDGRLYLGGYFQYAIGFANTNEAPVKTVCTSGYVECSVRNLQLGVNADYFFLPRHTLDPWIGLGIGYEDASLSGAFEIYSASVAYRGFDFLNFEAGIDWRVAAGLRVAPFVNVGLGEYEGCSASTSIASISGQVCSSAPKGIHTWTTLGMRWGFDLGV